MQLLSKDQWMMSVQRGQSFAILVSEISNRVISNEERFLASYLSPVKHQSLTPDIVDRVFAAYATDLGRIDEFIDETGGK
jgi:acyl-coenzyme A synthetase/AMP-(fatty) acid ligase